jgi:hypothetical protein
MLVLGRSVNRRLLLVPPQFVATVAPRNRLTLWISIQDKQLYRDYNFRAGDRVFYGVVPFPKTYRTNAGWALSIGAILALFSNLRNEPRAVISLAIIGALGFLWSAWEHEWIRWKIKSIPKVLLILGVFCSIAWFAWPPKTLPASEPLPAVAIFAECEMASLPITIAPETSLHLVSLNRKFMLSQDWGLADIINRTDQRQQWPSKQTMDSEEKKHKADGKYFNPGVFGFRCDVSNHGQLGVLDVAVPMKLWFGDKGGEENAIKYTPILSPLDAGEHFVFYIVNDCPVSASGVLPDTVSLTIVGETQRRSVRLNLPHRNPVEPIMGFFPSSTQWVRQQPCE